MENLNINTQNYLISGFKIIDGEIETDKIQYLRNLILENPRNYNKNTIDFIDFNEELRSLVVNLFTSNSIKNFISKNSQLDQSQNPD